MTRRHTAPGELQMASVSDTPGATQFLVRAEVTEIAPCGRVAIGYAEPRHGTRSQGIGAYQEDGEGLNPRATVG